MIVLTTTFVRKAAMILALIAGCEVAFWVLLLAALTARYVLRARRISTLLLWCLPVVDLMLLAAVLARLASGAPPQAGDGLGALYLGFTVMFVGPMTRAVDGWFARRFGSSRAAPAPPRYGMARARHEWSQLGRAVIAAAISAALLGVMAAVTGAASGASTVPLTRWFATLGVALAVWFLVAASYTVFPKKDPAN